jgi:hypothetical protein
MNWQVFFNVLIMCAGLAVWFLPIALVIKYKSPSFGWVSLVLAYLALSVAALAGLAS